MGHGSDWVVPRHGRSQLFFWLECSHCVGGRPLGAKPSTAWGGHTTPPWRRAQDGGWQSAWDKEKGRKRERSDESGWSGCGGATWDRRYIN